MPRQRRQQITQARAGDGVESGHGSVGGLEHREHLLVVFPHRKILADGAQEAVEGHALLFLLAPRFDDDPHRILREAFADGHGQEDGQLDAGNCRRSLMPAAPFGVGRGTKSGVRRRFGHRDGRRLGLLRQEQGQSHCQHVRADLARAAEGNAGALHLHLGDAFRQDDLRIMEFIDALHLGANHRALASRPVDLAALHQRLRLFQGRPAADFGQEGLVEFEHGGYRVWGRIFGTKLGAALKIRHPELVEGSAFKGLSR